MVKMISWSGTEMYVAENRVDEYKAAGCVLAAETATKAEPVKEQPKKATPSKSTTAKKATKTKKTTAKK